MANLSVTFAGIKLRNPFIISSSGITGSHEKIRKLDSLGAGAIILKSLFEEQINYEIGFIPEVTDYTEELEYLKAFVKGNNVGEYISLIKEAKKAVHIPIFASINCVSAGEWMNFVTQIEAAGADAIELNVFILPSDKFKSAQEYEKIYFDIVEGIREKVKIPLIIKLGSNFTNLNYIVHQLYLRNANAVTLFNRFYEPDININEFRITSSEVLSSPADIRQSLRWSCLISRTSRDFDIAASTGIHSGEAAIKQILAGAKAVQVCSALYKSGLEILPKMIDRFEFWMIEHNFKTVEEFRGKLNYSDIPDPALYERAQFIKYFSSHE
jgi:dihydroorotate dehydrogenase (fumarate)